MESVSLNVLLADDHPLMLLGMQRALEESDDIHVVGQARSGTELLDVKLPELDGVSCIEQIELSWPGTKSVVLTECEDSGAVAAALRAGASAYIAKSVNPGDIAAVLRLAAKGVR